MFSIYDEKSMFECFSLCKVLNYTLQACFYFQYWLNGRNQLGILHVDLESE